MADRIVSWGGFDSKSTSGMGVTGSFSVSGSMTTNADIFLYSTSSRVSNVRFFGEYGAGGQGSYHNLAVDSSNNFTWTAFRGGSYDATPLTLSGGSNWLIPGTMKIGGITAASINSNGSYTGAYATLTLTGGGYSDAINPSINFITWDGGETTSRFQIHSRTPGGANGKIVAVPNNGNFIIGSSTDLSAKLAVKGSGTTSSTTSFLVQNSSGNTALQIKDDLTSTFSGSVTISATGNSLNLPSGGRVYFGNREVAIGELSTAAYEGVSVGWNCATQAGGIAIGKNMSTSTFNSVLMVGHSSGGLTATSAYTVNILGTNTSGISILGTTSNNLNSTEISIGQNSQAKGAGVEGSIAIGRGAVADGTYAIALSAFSEAASGEFVVGSRGKAITNIYFGSGKQSPVIGNGVGASYTINGSGANGTDFAGGNLTLAGGKGTGTGSAADVIFATAVTGSTGTTLQSLTNRVWIKGHTGNVGIGTSTPSASLHISGASSNVLLEIDSPAVNNILYVSGSGNIGFGTNNPGAEKPNGWGSGGYSLEILGPSNQSTGVFLRRGNFTGIGLDLWAQNGGGNSFIDNRYDSAGASGVTIRVRTSGTPRTVAIFDDEIGAKLGDWTNNRTNAVRIEGDLSFRSGGGQRTITGPLNTSLILNALPLNSNEGVILQYSGSTGFILNNSGNVGIGRSTPGYKLDVSGSSNFTGNMIITGSATNSLLVKGSGTTSSTTALLVQDSAGTEYFKLTDDAALTFTGLTRLSITTATQINSRLVVFNTNGSGGGYSAGYDFKSGYGGFDGNTAFRIWSNVSTSRVAIGNVAENTVQNNNSKLYIDNTESGGRNKGIKLNVNFANISTEYNGIQFDTIENGSGGAFVGSQYNTSASSYGSDLVIFTTTESGAGSYTETARFVGKSQSLSIGAGKNPTATLHVSGSGRFTNSLTVTGSLTISGSNAAVTMPSRPAFRVTGSGTMTNLTTTQNGDGTLNQNNWAVDYQQGSALTGSTGVFTAPLAGLYQISLVGRNSGYSSGISQLAVVKYSGASSAVQIMVEWASSSTMNHTGGSSITYMNVGDTLKLKVLAGEINFDGNDNWSVAYIG